MFCQAIKKFKPDYFLYENNKFISNEIKEQIGKDLNAPLQYINSSSLSAQNRQRFYVHNISTVTEPINKNIILNDILCKDPSTFKYITDGEMDYMFGNNKGKYNDRWTFLNKSYEEKSNCLTANYSRGVPYNILAQEVNDMEVDKDYIYHIKNSTMLHKGVLHNIKLKDGDYIFRKLSPEECEALQTLPTGFTSGVSDSNRYKCLGNGWTADVIIHILSFLNIPKDYPIEVLSMYDGIGTGRYCFDKLGYTNITYKAYEIDKYAMKIAVKNYPDIIECGSTYQIRLKSWEY